MSYIVIWRHRHRDPHVSVDTNNFLETYSTYEEAEKSAKETVDQEGSDSQWYFDYAIYEEANG